MKIARGDKMTPYEKALTSKLSKWIACVTSAALVMALVPVVPQHVYADQDSSPIQGQSGEGEDQGQGQSDEGQGQSGEDQGQGEVEGDEGQGNEDQVQGEDGQTGEDQSDQGQIGEEQEQVDAQGDKDSQSQVQAQSGEVQDIEGQAQGESGEGIQGQGENAQDEDPVNQPPTIKVTRRVESQNEEARDVEVTPDDPSDDNPQPEVTNIDNLTVVIIDEESSLNTDKTVSFVRVTHTGFNSSRPDAPIDFEVEQDAQDTTRYKKTFTQSEETNLAEGTNVIEVFAEDTEGNKASAWKRTIIVDKQGPVPTLETDEDEQPISSTTYASRTMTLTLTDETSVDTDSVEVKVIYLNGEETDISASLVWTPGSNGAKVAVATFTLDQVGNYRYLSVRGKDGLGNESTEGTTFFALDFSISDKSTIAFIYDAAQVRRIESEDGTTQYWCREVSVTITVPGSRAKLNREQSAFDLGEETRWTYNNRKKVWTGTLDLAQGAYMSVSANLTYNTGKTESLSKSFVGEDGEGAILFVDKVAPQVVSAQVSQAPHKVWKTQTDNSREGLYVYETTTSVTLQLTDGDAALVGGLWKAELIDNNGNTLADPTFTFAGSNGSQEQDGSGSEQTGESGGEDEPVTSIDLSGQSDVVTLTIENDGERIENLANVKVTDLAGNYRVWTINGIGEVFGEMSDTGVDATLFYYDDTYNRIPLINPLLALVVDNVAPKVALLVDDKSETDEGFVRVASPGSNKKRKLTIEVDETNLELLKNYSNQTILDVTYYDKDGEKHEHEAQLALGTLARKDGSTYQASTFLGDEGDYEATGTILDIADHKGESSITFSIDRTKPVVAIRGIDENGNYDNNKYSRSENRKVSVEVTERHFDASNTPIVIEWVSPNGQKRATYTFGADDKPIDYEPVDGQTCPEASAWVQDPNKKGNSTTNTRVLTLHDQGTYTITVDSTDVAGNHAASPATEEYVIDWTPPAISFEWRDGITHEDTTKQHEEGTKSYFNSPQVLVITVEEANWRDDGFANLELLGRRRSVAVSTNPDGEESSGVFTETGKRGKEGLPTYSATVTFGRDAANDAFWSDFTDGGWKDYVIAGVDMAGNIGTKAIKAFTTDLTKPSVELSLSSKANPQQDEDDESGTRYYRLPVTITAIVKDRNLDVASTLASAKRDFEASHGVWDEQYGLRETTETNGDTGKPDYKATDYVATWEARATYDEGAYVTPTINVVDLATNSNKNDGGAPFVVDRTAPTITSVVVSPDPTPTYSGEDDEGVRQFYQVVSSVTVHVADNFRIRSGSARLDDPDGEYTKALTISADKKTGSVTVDLVDAMKHLGTDTEFDRKIILAVEDVAGNKRTWSIDRTGTVDDTNPESTPSNTRIDGQEIYPLALIHDRTSPVARLSGVNDGAYYNTTQNVLASIDEFNFNYLKKYLGSRAVLHVSSQSGDASLRSSGWEVEAARFNGSGRYWSFTQPFESDGHYRVWVEFRDIANNPSNMPVIERFTIDKTVPIITIAFDNNDAHNGNYYNAYRTATITVVEHNFDPSLFSVQTNGSIGGWSSSGDTHTCIVSFGADGTYNLTVSGKDMAGNEAVPVSEPEFVIDTQAPTITFGGVGERLGMEGVLAEAEFEEGEDYERGDAYHGTLKDGEAYNGIVAPAITFEDEQNYNTMGWTVELVGNKVGNVTDSYHYGVSDGSNSQTVAFEDFGLLTNTGGGEPSTSYDANADDVYTIHATLKDMADNEVEGDITFSVNRFGSNYIVSVLNDETGAAYGEEDEILSDSPRIVVHEINVSGVDSELDSNSVSKEYANTTTDIMQDAEGSPHKGEGYQLVVPKEDETLNSYGWAEYVYTIRAANFGAKTEDGAEMGEGQGLYRVNVSSDDTASNGNNTAEYWSSDVARETVEAKVGTAEFVLDEQGPTIDAIDLPSRFSVGEYEASFHVTDTLTSARTPNEVTVLVDGAPAEALASEGDGTYTFVMPARSFAWRNVSIKVTDYAGRSDEAGSQGLYITKLYPELATLFGVLAGAAAVAYFIRRRRDLAEPEAPTRRRTA